MPNKKDEKKPVPVQDNKVMLTGLWLKKQEDGTPYFTGNLGMGNILIFKNKHKTSENSPDYFMFLAPKTRPAEEAEDNPFEGLL